MHLLILSTNTLCQLKALLKEISVETYNKPIIELSNATIGQHTRHIVEFYSCLIQQLKTNNVVNYDKRLRNMSLETSLERTIKEIDFLCEELSCFRENNNIAIEGCLGDKIFCLSTSIEREVLYVLEHAIHHMAIIKIAINIIGLNIDLAPNFGVAESTIAHKKCVQ